MEVVTRAIAFAAERHANQRRNDVDMTPYINHPIRVLRHLVKVSVSTADVLAAAVLHDTLEDTETTYDELCAEFGPAIALLVQEVTDNTQLPREERRKAQVERVKSMSLGAKLIKLADKLDNVMGVCSSTCTKDVQAAQEYCRFAAAVGDACRPAFDSVSIWDPVSRGRRQEQLLRGGKILLRQLDDLLQAGIIDRGGRVHSF